MGDVVQMSSWGKFVNALGFGDSFTNFLAGLGVPGRDKSVSHLWTMNVLSYDELFAAYRGDWLARKIVELPAFDMTRAWRNWEGTDSEVAAIEEAELAFGLQRKVFSAIVMARLFGGSAIVMGVDQGRFEDEIDLDKVGKGDLKFIHVVQKQMISAGPLVRDITSPWFGQPSYYERSNQAIPPAPGGVQPLESSPLSYKPGAQIYIHPSRVIRLIGHDYPDIEMAPDAWGDSVLQTVQDALRDAGLVSSSIAAMVAEAKLDVIKVDGLTERMSTDAGTRLLTNRFANANVAKSVVNALLLDKNEEWERKELHMANMDKVLQMYLLIASAAADIPATRLLSREPSGLNATGDQETRNYYDRLSSDQKVRLTPLFSPLDEVLLRHIFGKRPKQCTYAWNPLWQLSDVDKADRDLKQAQGFKVDCDSGLFDPTVLLKARVSQLDASGTYPGLQAAIDEHGLEAARDDWVETKPGDDGGDGGKDGAKSSGDNSPKAKGRSEQEYEPEGTDEETGS